MNIQHPAIKCIRSLYLPKFGTRYKRARFLHKFCFRGDVPVNKIALGAAALLLSTAAYAQPSMNFNANTNSSATTTQPSTSSGTTVRQQTGSQTETTGASRSQAVGTDTNV